MARALRCDWADWWAMLPFAPVEIEGRWWIAASDDLTADGDVLLIDGITGQMRWADDHTAVGFWGGKSVAPVKVYANGLTFARDWVAARLDLWRTMKRVGAAHQADAVMHGVHMPGLAMIGTPDRIGNFDAIRFAETVEIDTPPLRQRLADALLRSARLPTITVGKPKLATVRHG
jgi:hypothetical protein